MKLDEAIKTLDESIPSPQNKMVDSEHMGIAIAWQTIKKVMYEHAKKHCNFCGDFCGLDKECDLRCEDVKGYKGDS